MKAALWILPFLIQSLVIAADEFRFHRRRHVPKWEKWGHSLDTLSLLLCFSSILFLKPDAQGLKLYGLLAISSCLFVTKDEFIHSRLCSPMEHWLHAVLFLLHPLVLLGAAALWFWYWDEAWSHRFIGAECLAAGIFFIYQLYRAASKEHEKAIDDRQSVLR